MINVKILDSDNGVVLALYNPDPDVINLVKTLHPDYIDDIDQAGVQLTQMIATHRTHHNTQDTQDTQGGDKE